MATKVTVTGLTAARMLEIEAESIVSARISTGHLYLKNHAGTEFDVGVVTGATGATGPVGPAGSVDSVNGIPGPIVVLTAANVGAVPTTSQATPIAKGLVELATSAETVGGVDATRAVTPDGLTDWATPQLPVGMIIMAAGGSDVGNYFVCNGRSLERTTYPALFSACGTKFGSVDSTHFNLPDMRGRVAVGQDSRQTEFDTLGEAGGSKTHGHTLSAAGQAIISIQAVGASPITMQRVTLDPGPRRSTLKMTADNAATSGDTDTTTTGAALNGVTDSGSSLQPYGVLSYMIKWK